MVQERPWYAVWMGGNGGVETPFPERVGVPAADILTWIWPWRGFKLATA